MGHIQAIFRLLKMKPKELSPDFSREQKSLIILLKMYYQSMYTALIQVKVGEAWRGTQLLSLSGS